MRDQSRQITTDHNSSEENIHSDESASRTGANDQHRERPYFTTRSGKVCYKTI